MRVHPDADWMTVNEVAKRTDRTRQWVHDRIKDGTLKAEREGRRVYVRGTSVANWMMAEMRRLLDRVSRLSLNLPYK